MGKDLSRLKFRWVEASKGPYCQQQRCEEMAVANRLCATHNAWWMSHACQPPMPNFERDGSVALEDQLTRDAREAKREFERLASFPMRTQADAERMRKESDAAGLMIGVVRQSKRSSIAPLIAQAKRLKKAHDVVIEQYRDYQALADLRLEEFAEAQDRGRALRHSDVVARLPGVARRAKKVGA